MAISAKSRPVRRGLRKLSERSVLLDRFEPESLLWRRAFQRRGFDAGYLVTPSFSPAVVAARSLISQGRPYVVDMGDPWSLEAPPVPGSRWVDARRERGEVALLGGAAGIVATTDFQASEIESRFPATPLLVRPSGYQTVDTVSGPDRPAGEDGVLRIAHFGRFDMAVRLDPTYLLESLAASGRWDRVVFTQFGPDPSELPTSSGPDLVLEAREAILWPEAVAEARRHDLALVIGNRPERKVQMPSKVIEYLSLPIPRVALCSGTDDSLFGYARKLPGYLVLTADDREMAGRVNDHLEREWNLGDLEAPEEESWEAVAPEVASFVDSCLGSALAIQVDGDADGEGVMVG